MTVLSELCTELKNHYKHILSRFCPIKQPRLAFASHTELSHYITVTPFHRWAVVLPEDTPKARQIPNTDAHYHAGARVIGKGTSWMDSGHTWILGGEIAINVIIELLKIRKNPGLDTTVSHES